MGDPVVLFEDAEKWWVTYLDAGLTARSELYADGVYVSTSIPDPRIATPARMVIVRRDGGPELTVASELVRLGINVYAATDEDVANLTILVRALVKAAAGDGPVRKTTVNGHLSLPNEDTYRRRYFAAEAVMRAA